MELRGPTLTLRYPAQEDAEQLLAQAADAQVTKWFSWGPYTHVDQPRTWIAQQEQRRNDGVQIDFVIDHAEHGVLGVIGLTELSARDRRAIVGTWIGREHWGTGVNDEAKALIVHLAFAVCGMERVSAYANPDNGRSVRALEKIGFRLEGTLRGWHRHADRQLDVNIVGLLKDEWRDGAGRLSAMEVETSGLPPTAWLVAG